MMQQMKSQRVIDKIAEKTGLCDVTRTDDLKKATEDYYFLRENINKLLLCLKEHQKSMNLVRNTRLKVALQMQVLAEGTPLSECVISRKMEQSVPQKEGNVHKNTGHKSNKSYVEIVDTLDQRSMVLIDKFRLYVVEYTLEWKKILKNRVTQSLASFEKNRLEYDHYQRKVSVSIGFLIQNLFSEIKFDM
mmetsp:Transcript_23926/g.54456  ORF Transcript_23926/g.54456 Transcript_23926/m.54456 type:complete len:190 (-) Transcript_23926:2038-2607(-)